MRAAEFLESMNDKFLSKSFHVNVILWMYHDGYLMLPENTRKQIQNISTLSMRFYSNQSLDDYNIGRHKKDNEYVTAILESLLSESFPKDSKAILISTSHEMKLTPLKDFPNYFKQIRREESVSQSSSSSMEQYQVRLMGKTKRMTSVSDWHDLMIAALLIGDPAVQTWLKKVREMYYRHASGRLAATLFDPRPALLEASLQLRSSVRVGYFRSGEICVRKSAADASRCKDLALIELHCLDTDVATATTCLTVTIPIAWRQTVSRSWDSLSFKTGVEESMWDKSLHEAAEHGALRFLLGAGDNKPAPFCWEVA